MRVPACLVYFGALGAKRANASAMANTKRRRVAYPPQPSEAEFEAEVNRWLQASTLACDVADAWAAAEGPDGGTRVPFGLRVALDRLERVTRHSAMRRVRVKE